MADSHSAGARGRSWSAGLPKHDGTTSGLGRTALFETQRRAMVGVLDSAKQQTISKSYKQTQAIHTVGQKGLEAL